MPSTPKPPGERSISVGGNVTGSALTTGDHNTVTVTYQTVALPAPESVDIKAEMGALRALLTALQSPDGRKIGNAVADIEVELTKPEPDKDEIGRALERALGYAEKASDFGEKIGELAPKVANAVAWLGKNWYKLLAVVGLSV